MTPGSLKVYLGSAPGVGKTYAMLLEAHELRRQGRDIVIAYVEDHGRVRTAELTEGLDFVPRQQVPYRGSLFPEMDLDAVLARKPEIAVVDELAHTNIPSPAGNIKRWQDVQQLLAAGIDVISTVNIQHLESLNDVVTSITGIRQRETIPDLVLREADEIELVDLSPDALRIRLSKGEVYSTEKVDAALSNYFRVGNLTALRELALLWLADQVEEGLAKYRAEKQIGENWPTRERIVVAVTGGPESEALIRRGMGIVGRIAGRELMAVHVISDDGIASGDAAALIVQRSMVEEFGGTWHTVVGDDVAAALLEFARSVGASQLVLGVSRDRFWRRFWDSGIGTRVVNGCGDIDVHIVTHPGVRRRPRILPKVRPSLTTTRRLLGWAAALGLPVLATVVLLSVGSESLTLVFLAFITLVVFVALIGGLLPALVAALSGTALINWFFTHPIGTFTIYQRENLIALVFFVTVAAAVAWVVDLAARRSAEALSEKSRAELLSELASGLISEDSVEALLDQLRETFAKSTVALAQRGTDRSWTVVAASGAPLSGPKDADEVLSLGDSHSLLLCGKPSSAPDQRIIEAYAGRIASTLDRERLRKTQIQAEELSAANAIRTALLAAVSHDLRTPLAGIKAAVSSLRLDDVALDPEDQRELLETIEDSTDKLTRLVANLLDMSRVQAGAVAVASRNIDLAEVIVSALSSIDDRDAAATVHLALANGLPQVAADFGLLERVIANLVENALLHGQPSPVRVSADLIDDWVEVRVVDRGPGVSRAAKERIFLPFQRLDDRREGVGLGLAVARGLTEGLGGTLEAEDTPGGGLTMVLRLRPVAPTTPDLVGVTDD